MKIDAQHARDGENVPAIGHRIEDALCGLVGELEHAFLLATGAKPSAFTTERRDILLAAARGRAPPRVIKRESPGYAGNGPIQKTKKTWLVGCHSSDGCGQPGLWHYLSPIGPGA
jgi:hypothetical protein